MKRAGKKGANQMIKETGSIKTFAGISATAIKKARKTYGDWGSVADYFGIRKETIRSIAKEFGIFTGRIKKVVKPVIKLTKIQQRIKKVIEARDIKRHVKKLKKIKLFREKQHYQLILTARFVCDEHDKPTQMLTGYSLGRIRGGFPNEKEQELMRDEAIANIVAKYLGGNSECEIVEDSVTTEIKEYDPVIEGKRLREVRTEAKRQREAAGGKRQPKARG